MISPKSVEYDWLKSISENNRKIDIILVEKVIRALILLESIARSNANFIFKGGTALMLLLDTTKRLSIDIDILVQNQDLENFSIKRIFEKYILPTGFYKYEKIERKSLSKINKEHYKFYYKPNNSKFTNDDYILLDILYENINYSKTIDIDINSKFLIIDEDIAKVRIPNAENLLGDKLTAFAPNTTGIPYEKGGISRGMEIIKQLFDISCIFDIAQDLSEIKESFYKFVATEAKYRELMIDSDDVLDDIFHTSYCISTRGIEGICDINILNKGIKSLSSYIFSQSYHIEKTIIDASKTAYLATLIKTNSNEIEKYTNPFELLDWTIIPPLNTKLNKLKKSNPEAFFYWYKVYELKSINY